MAKKGKNKRRKMSRDTYTESYKTRDEGGSTRKGAFDFKKAGYTEVKYYKPSEGGNKIVIVPYVIASKNHPKVKAGKAEIGDLDYLMDVYVHKYVGASEADIVCPKENYGKPCPICDIQRAMYSAAKSEEDKKAAGKLRAKRRVAYNILEVKKGEIQEELKIFEVSHFLFEKELIEEAVDCGDGDDIIAFADPEDGAIVKFRVSIEKSKEFGDSPRYKSFGFAEREEEIEDSVIDEAISFDKALVVLSPDEILALYEGEDDDDDDEEEEKPKKSKSKKSKKKVEEPEDDEEDDEEDEDEPEGDEPEGDEEEEDEPEEKPKKSKSKSKSKKKKEPEPEPEEDEDEPEEDDEDEEEEEPKKSSKSKGKSSEKAGKSKSSKKKKSSDDECPEGHDFGTDCDEKKECNRCELWEACSEAQENM